MAKRSWAFRPAKASKPKVPDEIKLRLEEKGNDIIEKVFKPKFIKPAPEPLEFNHLSDIYTKWYRNYFYFCSKFICSPENSISPSFESKFARMEYLGSNKFEVSYMRHTEKWMALQTGSMEECLKRVSELIPY